jgi:hypothetical protein
MSEWKKDASEDYKERYREKRRLKYGMRDRKKIAPVIEVNGVDCRKCTKCGKIKPIELFYERGDKRGYQKSAPRSWCNTCRSTYDKNTKACAKKFCKKIPKEKLVELECHVCGTKYGMLISHYNAKMRQPAGNQPKCCSRACLYISMTKNWQQTQSPYAKKIKELQKEYKCPTTS